MVIDESAKTHDYLQCLVSKVTRQFEIYARAYLILYANDLSKCTADPHNKLWKKEVKTIEAKIKRINTTVKAFEKKEYPINVQHICGLLNKLHEKVNRCKNFVELQTDKNILGDASLQMSTFGEGLKFRIEELKYTIDEIKSSQTINKEITNECFVSNTKKLLTATVMISNNISEYRIMCDILKNEKNYVENLIKKGILEEKDPYSVSLNAINQINNNVNINQEMLKKIEMLITKYEPYHLSFWHIIKEKILAVFRLKKTRESKNFHNKIGLEDSQHYCFFLHNYRNKLWEVKKESLQLVKGL